MNDKFTIAVDYTALTNVIMSMFEAKNVAQLGYRSVAKRIAKALLFYRTHNVLHGALTLQGINPNESYGVAACGDFSNILSNVFTTSDRDYINGHKPEASLVLTGVKDITMVLSEIGVPEDGIRRMLTRPSKTAIMSIDDYSITEMTLHADIIGRSDVIRRLFLRSGHIEDISRIVVTRAEVTNVGTMAIYYYDTFLYPFCAQGNMTLQKFYDDLMELDATLDETLIAYLGFLHNHSPWTVWDVVEHIPSVLTFTAVGDYRCMEWERITLGKVWKIHQTSMSGAGWYL